MSSDFTVYTYDRRGRGTASRAPPTRSIGRSKTSRLSSTRSAERPRSTAFRRSSRRRSNRSRRGHHQTDAVRAAGRKDEPDPLAAAARSELLAAGRRREVVEQFLTGIGIPPEAIAGLRQSPEWPRLETVAHTLAYDDAITSDPTLWTKRAPPCAYPRSSSTARRARLASVTQRRPPAAPCQTLAVYPRWQLPQRPRRDPRPRHRRVFRE
jgi:hypothetical protein